MIESAQSVRYENNQDAPAAKRPWSVDRWGRLFSGSGVLLLTTLGILHHPAWLLGSLLVSINLVFASLSDYCLLHDILIRLGAKEREDLFLPGGIVRPDVARPNRNVCAD